MTVTDRGAVRGSAIDGVTNWKGIPFAAPPVGPLRFSAPKPHACWRGVRDASDFGAPCPQVDGGIQIGSEDCLTLNVWTPTKRAAPRPVMVFVHGGGHLNGSAANEVAGVTLYDGTDVARTGDVVVVTVQYRIGALGWLADPALEPEGAAGNYGLLDQIAALKWVQRNIAGFGGDPKRVLLFGESAGAVDTCLLVSSPTARGLFSRALIQSGACRADDRAAAERNAASFTQAAGCAGAPAAAADCLRALPVSRVLVTNPGSVDLTSIGRPRYGPYVDGRVIPEDPLTRIEAGRANRVPMVVGSNADETAIFVRNVQTPEDYYAALQGIVGAAGAARIVAEYPVDRYPNARAAMIAATSDAFFTCGAGRIVRAAVAGQGKPVYRYIFTHTMEGGTLRSLGAFHGLELFFVFGHLATTGYTPTPAEAALSTAMIGYWSRFAETGDPNGKGAVVWPEATAGADGYLDLNVTIAAGDGVRTAQCVFWDSLIP